MYGLVNKGVKDLVISNYGKETWTKIKKEAGVDIEFVGMKQYDDSITYDLVAAASKILGAAAHDILVTYGKYWITYTAKEGYGDMLESAGDNFVDFLSNLDNMHVRVGYTYEGLRPPSFSCTEIDEQTLLLEYHSHREGLSPLVEGLILGLGDRFNLSIALEQIKNRAEFGFDEFRIVYQTK